MRSLFIFVAIGILLVASCGGTSATNSQTADSRQLSFERELDALALPPGVDAELWEGLKDRFREIMHAMDYGRAVSLAPASDLSAVNDLAATANPDGTATLDWGYRNQGDYNQNKLVSVSDFTEIGRFYEVGWESPNWPVASLADGSEDGRVTVSDIEPIGRYYNRRVEGYKVQACVAPDATDGWEECAQVLFEDSTIPEGGHKRRFTCQIDAPVDGMYYRVLPFDGTDLGIASNPVQFNAVKPQVSAQVPEAMQGGVDAVWTATWANGTAPYSVTWEFGGGSEDTGPAPATSPDEQAVTMINTSRTDPANYTYTVTVVDASGLVGTATGAYAVGPDPHPAIEVTVPEDMCGGSDAQWSIQWNGGIAPYTVTWEFGGGATGAGPVILTSPATLMATMINPSTTETATYTYTITVTDYLGFSGIATDSYSVGPDPRPVVTVDVPTGMAGTQDADWSATWTNGIAPYTIEWEFGDGGTDIDPVAAVSPDLRTVGMINPSTTTDAEYTYTVTVTDSEGISGVATGGYTVGPSPNYAPEITSAVFTFATRELVVKATDPNDGETLNVTITEPPGLHADATGKTASSTGPLSAAFIWSADDPGAGGSGTSTVTVEDSLGLTDTTTVEITIPVLGNLYAIPQVETAAVDEPVTIVVTTDIPGFPFQQLCMVGLTVEPGAAIVEDSFNAGAIGGGMLEPDGIWAAMAPSSFMSSSSLLWHGDNGDGLERWEFALLPENGCDLLNEAGDLFNFQFSFSSPGTYNLGFVESTGDIRRTYYSDQDEYEYYWGDISNDHAGIAHSITVE